jgi:hypothetical protein
VRQALREREVNKNGKFVTGGKQKMGLVWFVRIARQGVHRGGGFGFLRIFRVLYFKGFRVLPKTLKPLNPETLKTIKTGLPGRASIVAVGG